MRSSVLKPLQVAHFPSHAQGNPYLDLLCGALRRQGVSIVPSPGKPSLWWLLWMWRRVDILHFHWPEIHYQRKNRIFTFVKFCHFAAFLLASVVLGRTVVWTAHNVEPHESIAPLDRWARRLMARVAHVVAHCQWAADEVRRRWGVRGAILVVPHGNYSGCYPALVSQEEARQQLGLPMNARVFVCFGALRGYKGIDSLLAAFRQIEGDSLRLLIAGKTRDSTLERSLREAVQSDSRVVFHPGFVPEDRVQIYFQAADFVVLPYERVTTSGSLILALSFGRGVIAPALGCIPEMIDTSAGIVYNSMDRDGLLKALRTALEMDSSAMGLRARQAAERLGWDGVAEKHAEFYHRIRGIRAQQ